MSGSLAQSRCFREFQNWQLIETARIVGTLGLLLENGVLLPTALKILRDIVTEPRYVAAVDLVHEKVRNGRRVADALADTSLLPPLAVRMLKVGDEVGDVSTIVRQASQFYEHKLGLGLDRLMGAIGFITIIPGQHRHR